MAHSDSDSSAGGEDIETDVLLGYASKDPSGGDGFSQLGGHPVGHLSSTTSKTWRASELRVGSLSHGSTRSLRLRAGSQSAKSATA